MNSKVRTIDYTVTLNGTLNGASKRAKYDLFVTNDTVWGS
jgi:hypothetical protein